MVTVKEGRGVVHAVHRIDEDGKIERVGTVDPKSGVPPQQLRQWVVPKGGRVGWGLGQFLIDSPGHIRAFDLVPFARKIMLQNQKNAPLPKELGDLQSLYIAYDEEALMHHLDYKPNRTATNAVFANFLVQNAPPAWVFQQPTMLGAMLVLEPLKWHTATIRGLRSDKLLARLQGMDQVDDSNEMIVVEGGSTNKIFVRDSALAFEVAMRVK